MKRQVLSDALATYVVRREDTTMSSTLILYNSQSVQRSAFIGRVNGVRSTQVNHVLALVILWHLNPKIHFTCGADTDLVLPGVRKVKKKVKVIRGEAAGEHISRLSVFETI